MKTKALAMITAVIITSAAIILTAGLSLLHGSAINESATDNESAILSDSVAEAVEMSEENTADNETADAELPILGDSGSELPVPSYEYENDIAIDIYEHATGKLVGQVVITNDEDFAEWERLFEEAFNPHKVLFNPNDDNADRTGIPQGKYRIEVYSFCAAGIAYSYGADNDNGIYELTQTGLPFAGGYALIEYANALIADEIAAIEAGENEAIDSDKAISAVIGFNGYWDNVERYTERFPYIEDN